MHPFRVGWAAAFAVALASTCSPREAAAQACCVGASGLTPGWLGNHERFLVGAQLRLAATHGTYPASGQFFVPTPGRDLRFETSLFASARVLPRGQVSVLVPVNVVRRRVGDIVETRTAVGDAAASARYDFVRAGERVFPGVALLGGVVLPTGRPPESGTPLLAADVSGTGAFEGNLGVSVEQTWHHVVLHGTALYGIRLPRELYGQSQHLGSRLVVLGAGGYVFDDDAAILGSVTYVAEGDATIGGDPAPDTGSRSTQVAALFITPLGASWRLRTSVFTDLPIASFGVNRPALGGTSLSLLRSWL